MLEGVGGGGVRPHLCRKTRACAFQTKYEYNISIANNRSVSVGYAQHASKVFTAGVRQTSKVLTPKQQEER